MTLFQLVQSRLHFKFKSFLLFHILLPFMLFKKVFSQSILPSFISLIGLMFSAAILSKLELSDVAIGIPLKALEQLSVLIPVMANLNGNFELNLSCRLGTCANTGQLKTSARRMQIYKANVYFMLLQSIILGTFCASFAIIASGLIGIFSTLRQFFILTVAAILTICANALVLGTFMNCLIVQCVYYGLDPDNVATPIAAAFGDPTTLLFFIMISNVCLLDETGFICFVVLVGLLTSAYYLHQKSNDIDGAWLHPNSLWSYLPYIASICITTFCGLAFAQELENFKGLASLAPVINGLSGGNTSIYASRLTTSFSINRKEDSQQIILVVWIVTLLNVLSLLLFSSLFEITIITTRLFIGSMITFHICLFILIRFVEPFCLFLNKKEIDLDAVVLPVLTALGDLGTLVYIVVFTFIDVIAVSF